MDGKSLDIRQQNIEKLKSIFPDIFSEDKVDLKRLEALIGEEYLAEKNHYELSWMGKADARYEIKKQSNATLNLEDVYIPETLKEEYKDKNIENVFIEGENLEVLKVLQRSYFNKVKMIYIDPPYNTGNDSFVYPDNYTDSKEDYEIDSGIRDEKGNLNKLDAFKAHTKENGQYHSKWLSMMYPRLYLARNLLKEDGVIFISIDDNEVANLRLLCDEIFGEDNFVESFVWRRRKTQANLSNFTAPVHDYIICYSKNKENLNINKIPYSKEFIKKTFQNPDNDPKGVYQTGPLARPANSSNKEYELTLPNGRKITAKWSCSQETFNRYVQENRLVIPRNGEGMPRVKIYLSELPGQIPNSWLDNLASNDDASREIENLFGTNAYFSFPKPIGLINHFIQIGSNANDLILDFFAGSGTTAQSVMELNKEDGGNRKFILVQLPEPLDKKTEAYKAGYNTIADICKERIKKSIDKIIKEDEKSNQAKFDFEENKSEQLLAFKHFKLNDSNFLKWNNNVNNVEDLQKQILIHSEPNPIKSSDVNKIYELLLQQGDTLTEQIEEKLIDGQIIYIVSKSTILFFNKYSEKILEFLTNYRPIKVICLDECFEDSQALTNFELQLKELKIDVKVV